MTIEDLAKKLVGEGYKPTASAWELSEEIADAKLNCTPNELREEMRKWRKVAS